MKNWKVQKLKHGVQIKGEHGEEIAICITHFLGEPSGYSQNEALENATLMASAPELFQMVLDLKNCIKRLTQDNLSQYERDTEAQWEGEAHELLTRINPGYYKNANVPA